ncbi:hypothetical protein V1264_007877 [Littorina saxatilis]|uniref:Methyltransferase FkbM domain-containing protein n=1 Tax=Littorina saxatilis TaxID=31220 RepID=A0AAN9AVW3_9CAEN
MRQQLSSKFSPFRFSLTETGRGLGYPAQSADDNLVTFHGKQTNERLRKFVHETRTNTNVKNSNNVRGKTLSNSAKLSISQKNWKSQRDHKTGLFSSLGLLSSRNATGWTRLSCNKSAKFRLAKLPTSVGNLSLYVYDSMRDDMSLTSWLLRGELPEKKEIEKFLEISKHLPLIDVGSNLGTVTLQAAMQKRQVVALEPVHSNAQRLCRSALDFDLDSYVHVILNAASAREGEVTLAADYFREMARFSVQGMPGKPPGYHPVTSYAILLDRLLEVVPFRTAALKIDVEAHEGYVLAGAERLFQEMDIPLVWLEWEHVIRLPRYGAEFILMFMHKHGMEAHDVISKEKLQEDNWKAWPATVLWKRKDNL